MQVLIGKITEVLDAGLAMLRLRKPPFRKGITRRKPFFPSSFRRKPESRLMPASLPLARTGAGIQVRTPFSNGVTKEKNLAPGTLFPKTPIRLRTNRESTRTSSVRTPEPATFKTLIILRGLLVAQFLLIVLALVTSDHVFGQEAPYKLYVDPAGRFSFEYPATMKLQSTSDNEVRIYHPAASFGISVFVEQKQGNSNLTADALLAALKKTLREEMKSVSVLGEGKLAELQGSQGYVAISFTNKKGIQMVQMVQYYVADGRFLRMTLTDRAEGFKNLEPVIRKIHQSLKILKPKLK